MQALFIVMVLLNLLIKSLLLLLVHSNTVHKGICILCGYTVARPSLVLEPVVTKTDTWN